MRTIIALISCCTVAAAAPVQAHAQSLSPMQDTVKTFSDRFAVKLAVRNPYDSTQKFDLYVWDEDGSMVEGARMSRPRIVIAPNGVSSFFVQVPMKTGAAERTVYICVQSQEFRGAGGAGVRGQVCGKYRAIRIG